MSQKEVIAIKPLSRFVEHFDVMPPTELLDMIGEEEHQQKPNAAVNDNDKSKKPTPLFAITAFDRYESSNNLNGPEQLLKNTPSSPTSPTRKSYLDRHDSSPIVTLDNSPMPAVVSQSSNSSPHSSHSGRIEATANNINKGRPEVSAVSPEQHVLKSISTAKATSAINSIAMNNNLSNIAQQQPKQSQQDQLFFPSPGGTRKKLSSKSSLNRAEFIIRRYESWNRFISLFVSWVNEIAKQSIQSEKTYQASLKESKFFSRKSDHPSTNNGMHGFTADLALQEQKIGRHLQTEQIPNLEKFKKECTFIIKNLKSRPDLNQEEFLRRAEITASLISQLSKTCMEARRTIEKGAPLVNDPWLINLYVLRQLRGEVSEENRLRKLLVPIQQSIRDFEGRLFKAVEETLKVCLEKPVTLSDTQLSKIQISLNQVITNNWATFASMNKKDIVNEENPLKHYLKINYNCKNDPLVMTVYKGQLERRTGVLNSKYTQRFFVTTKSGFLHQFKLNDQVSPEFSIYLSKYTVVPCMDISDLNRFYQHPQEEKVPKDGYTFEVQRSGSVLQRDKSYVFRAAKFEDMVSWCQHISEVATQSPEATLRPVFIAAMQSSGALVSSNSVTTSTSIGAYYPYQQEPERQLEPPIQLNNANGIRLSIDSYHLPQEEADIQPLSPQLEVNKGPEVPEHQVQLQETTPPPSPIHKEENNYIIDSVLIEERRVSEDSSGSFHSFEYETIERPKLYAPQLNI